MGGVEVGAPVAEARGRPVASGKFLRSGGRALVARGVTYGTFAPGDDGAAYPPRDRVEHDLAAISALGANAIRVYTAPPRWLLDAAHGHDIAVMVGLAWPDHTAFLDSRRGARSIVDGLRADVATIAGHPAVLCVAVGNEIPASIVRWHGPRRIEAFLATLCQAVRAEDPAALVTYVNYPSTEYLELPFVDLVSFNVFLESTERFTAYLARLQNLAGDRPLVISELGLDSARWGPARQARVVGDQLGSAFAEGCAGAFVFSWTDDWHRGGAAVEDWAFGLTDAGRRPKPALWAARRAFLDPPLTTAEDWPRVSVVVCSRDGASTLADCLAGIAQLEYPDFETIIVDDGSVDATPEIAERFGTRVIRTPNRGLSAARNTGIAAATGEVVAFVDDDAIPDPSWLRHVVATLLAHEHVGVGGPNIAPPTDGLVARAVGAAPGGPNHVLLSDREAEHIPGCNMVFWKEALEAVEGFDEQFRIAGDDVDICWRLQERGWTLGFSGAAMVWHRRRASVRAYLRQQLQYGRAEALLERKWPGKYNRGGHLAWAGRMYAASSRRPGVLGRRRIRYGSWGENLFQSVYDRAPGTPGLLPLMPEWYLVIAVLGGMSTYDSFHDPLLTRAFGIPLSAFLLAASLCLLLVQGLRAGWMSTRGPTIRGAARARRAALAGVLYILQPLARLVGRLSLGLTPWRRRGVIRIGIPFSVERELWSESWRSARQRLLAIEARLRRDCMTVSRGGECDRWDIHARIGPLAAARVRLTLEEHGQGRQLLRVRVWPRWSVGFVALSALLIGLAAANLAAGDAVSSAVLASSALVLGYRGLSEGGASVASIVSAVVSAEASSALTAPDVRLDALPSAASAEAPDDVESATAGQPAPARERVGVGG